ncbi:MAG: SHOCT domain-containing protein [Solirubrobacterales bacterium]|nr:SHOCT domain-containing protein [Solirubrobacterales bacterium]
MAVQGTELALTRPVVQTAWAKANRAADQAFIALVNGGTKHVSVNQGVVTLNLVTILDDVASRLGLPSSLVAKLPPSAAHLTILKSDQIKYVQNIGRVVRHLALWLTIIVPLLYAAAIALARGRRRRTLMTVGFSIVLAGLLGVAGRKLLENNVTNALVSDASLRPAVGATLRIGTSLLGEIATAFILVGAVFVVAAWFAGPARLATVTRRAMAPFLRDRSLAAFTIVTGIMVLIFIWNPIPATGTAVGIIVFLALALLGTEVLRRQTIEEFPDARSGEATAALRQRWRSMLGRQGPTAGGDSDAARLPDELERLAALQRQGAISGEEYEAAKAKLLHA